jgi:hypothetical protein
LAASNRTRPIAGSIVGSTVTPLSQRGEPRLHDYDAQPRQNASLREPLRPSREHSERARRR